MFTQAVFQNVVGFRTSQHKFDGVVFFGRVLYGNVEPVAIARR